MYTDAPKTVHLDIINENYLLAADATKFLVFPRGFFINQSENQDLSFEW
jgi:hypothetical protein